MQAFQMFSCMFSKNSDSDLKETIGLNRHSQDVARLTKCLHLSSNPSVFNRSNGGILVFTRCNRQAALFTSAIWRMGRSLILVSESDCVQRTEFKSVLPSPLLSTLSVISIDNDLCNASSLAAEISSRDVGEVHVIIERDDFWEGDSPRDLGDLQRCYVSLLEAMRSNRQTELFFHAHGHTTEVQRADHSALQTGSDVALCSYNYDVGHYGDVMKYILFMYTTVYASLYEFRHIYLAAGPWVAV